jgi:hypothetical protein
MLEQLRLPGNLTWRLAPADAHSWPYEIQKIPGLHQKAACLGPPEESPTLVPREAQRRRLRLRSRLALAVGLPERSS